MTTFVVSLFLPYTIDFQNLPSSIRKQSPKANAFPGTPGSWGSIATPFTPLDRESSASDVDVRSDQQQGAHSVNTPQPRTPFQPHEAADFFKTPASSSSYFPSANDQRSLVRSDSYALGWAEGDNLNQPRSRADPAPPPTILEYSKVLSLDLSLRQKHQKTQDEHDQKQDGPDGGNEDKQEDGERRLRMALRKKKAHRSGSGSPKGYFSKSQWSVEPSVKANGGLLKAVKAATADESTGDVHWVGTLGFATDSLDGATKDDIQEKLEMEHNALPVYVSDSDYDGHYEHYCKTILWPVLHYQIPDHPKSKAYEDHSWEYYVHVNQAMADKLITSYKRGDNIWVHDYHLLLVPRMVRQKLPDAKIGFFLHTAFPSSEVFRCLSVRKQLLEGLLGANLVAFQTKEYAMHFLQTCSRLLIVEATNNGVQLENRFVNITWMPIGIDLESMRHVREESQVQDSVKLLQERYKGKHLIVARDKLDNVRGVRQKLLAYELFLCQYPEWKEKVVMIQVVTPLTDQPQLMDATSDIVTRIDYEHSSLTHQPLVFLRQNITDSQYLALLSAADLMLITSLREGMNLTAHDFIACQDGDYGAKKHGPLILSEFTGSSSIFEGNEISVNPWHYQQVASAIKSALEMRPDERERRHKNIHDIIARDSGGSWFKNLNTTLAKVHEEHLMRDTMFIPRLSVAQLSEKYKRSRKRLFILDYEGTLASLGKPSDIILTSPQRVLDSLNELLLDEKNIVYVMSAYKPEELERLFSRVPKLGIIAENGCYVREFGLDEWVTFADPVAMEAWKRDVRHMLQYYTERLEGSWIETRRCSMILHYDMVDDVEIATRQAGDCANHIDDACQAQRIHAVPIDRALLIEPIDWSKGTAAEWIMSKLGPLDNANPSLEEEAGMNTKAGLSDGENKKSTASLASVSSSSPLSAASPVPSSATSPSPSSSVSASASTSSSRLPDFLMVAGNDRADEGVFRWANNLGNDETIENVTTVSVGKRNTEAMASLTQGSTGLLSVLQRIAKLS